MEVSQQGSIEGYARIKSFVFFLSFISYVSIFPPYCILLYKALSSLLLTHMMSRLTTLRVLHEGDERMNGLDGLRKAERKGGRDSRLREVVGIIIER